MEFTDFIKLYGPLGLGWVGFVYLGKFVLDRYEKDIESKVQLATALSGLADLIRRDHGGSSNA